MIARYLVYMDGRYRSWTAGHAMRVRPGDTAQHTFLVVAVDATGAHVTPSPEIKGAAA